METDHQHLAALRKRLEKASIDTRTRLDVIQQDYLLSWLLEAIAQDEMLFEYLIFKGGTALKKCYFGNYRFSEDLDFTALQSRPEKVEIEKRLKNAVQYAEKLMREIDDIRLSFRRYNEKNPHPMRQIAFSIYAQYPWQRQPLTKVMVEISLMENLAFNCVEKSIIHPYGEMLNGKLKVYALEEIVTEKLRALLENSKKLHERGWGRSRVRDFYDLHQIIDKYNIEIDWPSIAESIHVKCHAKDITFSKLEDFFDPLILKDAKIYWERWLKPLTPFVSDFDALINTLKEHLNTKLFQQTPV